MQFYRFLLVFFPVFLVSTDAHAVSRYILSQPEYKKFACIKHISDVHARSVIKQIRTMQKKGKINVSPTCIVRQRTLFKQTPKPSPTESAVVIVTIVVPPSPSPSATFTAVFTPTPSPVEIPSTLVFNNVEGGVTNISTVTLAGNATTFTVQRVAFSQVGIEYASDLELQRLGKIPCSDTIFKTSCSVGLRYEPTTSVLPPSSFNLTVKTASNKTLSQKVTVTEQRSTKRCALPQYRVWNSMFGPGYSPVTYPGIFPISTDGGTGYLDATGKYKNWWVGGWEGPQQEIIEANLKEMASLRDCTMPWVVDIEHWPLTGDDATVEANQQRLKKIFDAVHSTRPDGSFGIYDQLPQRNYWTASRYQGALDDQPRFNGNLALWAHDDGREINEYNDWVAQNARLRFGRGVGSEIDYTKGLADSVDILFPSMYLFYVGGNDDAYLRWNMREAKKYGKWVIPYMMLALHDSTPGPIPLPRWQRMLEVLCEEGADGIVLWGGITDDWKTRVDMAKAVFDGKKCPK